MHVSVSVGRRKICFLYNGVMEISWTLHGKDHINKPYVYNVKTRGAL